MVYRYNFFNTNGLDRLSTGYPQEGKVCKSFSFLTLGALSSPKIELSTL